MIIIKKSVSNLVGAGLCKLKKDEARLKTLRAKLQAGEDSLIVEGFEAKGFILELHNKHAK